MKAVDQLPLLISACELLARGVKNARRLRRRAGQGKDGVSDSAKRFKFALNQ